MAGGRDAVFHENATLGAGLVRRAFRLDGDRDFVSVPHDQALNLGTGDFTINLWVYFADTNGEQVLMEKWVQRFPGSIGWTLTKLDGDVLRLAMASGDGSETKVDTAVLPIPRRSWIHFAVTRQGSRTTVYMNGWKVVRGHSLVNLNSDSSLKFGHRGNPVDTPGSEDDRGFYLNGRIDEAQVFVGRALPPEPIRAIFRAGKAGQCK